MTILHSNGISFASICSDDGLQNDLLKSGTMQAYNYTQLLLINGIGKDWTIACYNRKDFLELLNYWNSVSDEWKYYEKK